MSKMIESMEPRLLFHASDLVIKEDVLALNAEGAAAKADLAAGLAVAKADLKTIKAAVVAAHPDKDQRAVLATLQKEETAAVGKYKKEIGAILSTGKGDGVRLESALLSLAKHPTSIAIQAKVASDVGALKGVFSAGVLSTVEADAAAGIAAENTDLNALAAAVPSASSAVATAETDLTADLTTLSTSLTGIQTDIAKLATDLS